MSNRMAGLMTELMTELTSAIRVVRASVGHVATRTGSWRTTLVGLLTGGPVLLSEVMQMLAREPGAPADTRVVVLAIAVIIIGVLARDNVVRSESAIGPFGGDEGNENDGGGRA